VGLPSTHPETREFGGMEREQRQLPRRAQRRRRPAMTLAGRGGVVKGRRGAAEAGAGGPQKLAGRRGRRACTGRGTQPSRVRAALWEL
jgi:hypothetical protein